MSTLQDAMLDYKNQLQKGSIITAYQGLMSYFGQLRSHFQQECPQVGIPGGIYYGYMDMTYFPLVPAFFLARKLKIAVVFVHKSYRFEVWLAARNKTIQATVWQAIEDSGWDLYPLTRQGKGVDAILEKVVVQDPDFSDLPALTGLIESGVLSFIREMEAFLPELNL